MRYSIIIAVSVSLATVGLVVSAQRLTGSKPQAVESGAGSGRDNSTADSIVVDSARDAISQHDAKVLAAQKLAPPGTKSLLKVAAVMRHGDFVWRDVGVPQGEVTIWVDLRRQMISAYRQGHEIGTAVIIYGAEDKTSPEGRFPILTKQRHYHSRTYDAPMPASLFITDDGVALHGSPMSSRRASHGCIGLPLEFAEKLFDVSAVGDVVEITRSAVATTDSKGEMVKMR